MTEIKLPTMGTDVDCTCGRVHHILTRTIKVEQGVLDRIPALMDEYGLTGRCLIVSDTHTFEAAGRRVEQVLRRAGRAGSALPMRKRWGKS